MSPAGSRDKPAAPSGAEPAGFKHEIATDVAITGRINFPGDARIDGRLRGEVRADALLVIGETGVLHADVRAERLVVRGAMHGNVLRAHLVEVEPGARLIGNVEADGLVVRPGALLEGRCRIGTRADASAPQSKVITLDRSLQLGVQRRS